jgi:serine/threonine protein kinase
VLVSEYTVAKLSDFGSSRAKDARNMNMTMAGTPIFAAPEIFRAEGRYSEKVDVYSFGMLLVECAIATGGLPEFIQAMWIQDFPDDPQSLESIFNGIWDGNWHPVASNGGACLVGAPVTIQELASYCCAHNPSERPSFAEIDKYLSERVAEELLDSYTPFVRRPPSDGARIPDEKQRAQSINPFHAPYAIKNGRGAEINEVREQLKHAHHTQISNITVGPGVRKMVAASTTPGGRNSRTASALKQPSSGDASPAEIQLHVRNDSFM